MGRGEVLAVAMGGRDSRMDWLCCGREAGTSGKGPLDED